MQGIGAGRLLEAWEQGQTQHPIHRALTLLRIADPEQTIDLLASLSIGERDRRLLALRQRMFGSRFDAFATCPRCQERLELTFHGDQLPAGTIPVLSTEVTVDDGRSIAIRLPNTVDLLDTVVEPPERRVPALLERCAGPDLSPSAAEAVQSQMAELDPMARIELQLTCPACEHQWGELFDIASYLWTELKDHAIRLLHDTHTLARAYGWSEAEILSMTSRRRQVYLDLVVGA